jgi:hypothetical protein
LALAVGRKNCRKTNAIAMAAHHHHHHRHQALAQNHTRLPTGTHGRQHAARQASRPPHGPPNTSHAATPPRCHATTPQTHPCRHPRRDPPLPALNREHTVVVHSEADTLIPLAHSTELENVCKVRLVKVAGEPHKMYATAACRHVPPFTRAAPHRTEPHRTAPPVPKHIRAAPRPAFPTTTTPLASRWGIAKDGLLQRVVREVVSCSASS